MNKIFKYIPCLALIFNLTFAYSQDQILKEFDLFTDSTFTYEALRLNVGIGTRFSKNMGDTVNQTDYSIMLMHWGLSYDLLKKSKLISLNSGIDTKLGLNLDRYQIGIIPNITLGFNSKRRTKFPIGFKLMTGYDYLLDLKQGIKKRAHGLLLGCSLTIYGIEFHYSQTHLPNNGRNYIHNISISSSGGVRKFWKKKEVNEYYYD